MNKIVINYNSAHCFQQNSVVNLPLLIDRVSLKNHAYSLMNLHLNSNNNII